MRRALLACVLAARAAPPSSIFWGNLASNAALPLLPAHAPLFSVALESVPLAGSAGAYDLPVYVVRDAAAGGAVVAAWVERDSFLEQTSAPGLGELSLLAPTPALAPLALPPLERYGWAWLWGAKVTTIPWLDCCSVTGDATGFTFTASPDGATATLNQFQVWVPGGKKPGRDAVSNHTFTLYWDATYGYSVDATLALRINAPAAPAAVEMVNFLTPRLAQPWPAPLLAGGWPVPPAGAPLPAAAGAWPLPRSTFTAWANDSAAAAFTGFAENLLAGAALGRWPLPGAAGGTLALAPGAYSAGLSYGAEAGAGVAFAESICPTWADMHHVVVLPAAPAADGYFSLAPTFSLRFAPPAAADFARARAVDVHANGTGAGRWLAAAMVRVGAVETFEDQPVPLTAPLRALVAALHGEDLAIVRGAGAGFNGSAAAWAVAAASPAAAAAPYYNALQQPLVPLNASARYAFSAWVALDGGAVDARLFAGVWEADDFNQGVGAGPSFGRLWYANSSSARGAPGGAWASPLVRAAPPALVAAPPPARAGAWARLEVVLETGPWAAYADLRVIVVGAEGERARVDDWLFAPA